MSESKEIQVLRLMAWERAKGELESLMYTYWGSEEKYMAMRKAVDDFVKDVELRGLEE